MSWAMNTTSSSASTSPMIGDRSLPPIESTSLREDENGMRFLDDVASSPMRNFRLMLNSFTGNATSLDQHRSPRSVAAIASRLGSLAAVSPISSDLNLLSLTDHASSEPVTTATTMANKGFYSFLFEDTSRDSNNANNTTTPTPRTPVPPLLLASPEGSSSSIHSAATSPRRTLSFLSFRRDSTAVAPIPISPSSSVDDRIGEMTRNDDDGTDVGTGTSSSTESTTPRAKLTPQPPSHSYPSTGTSIRTRHCSFDETKKTRSSNSLASDSADRPLTGSRPLIRHSSSNSNSPQSGGPRQLINKIVSNSPVTTNTTTTGVSTGGRGTGSTGGRGTGSTGEKGTGKAGPLNILIVDRNPESRHQSHVLLWENGHNVALGGAGLAFLQVIEHAKLAGILFDVILMDIAYLETCDTVRSSLGYENAIFGLMDPDDEDVFCLDFEAQTKSCSEAFDAVLLQPLNLRLFLEELTTFKDAKAVKAAAAICGSDFIFSSPPPVLSPV